MDDQYFLDNIGAYTIFPQDRMLEWGRLLRRTWKEGNTKKYTFLRKWIGVACDSACLEFLDEYAQT